MWMNINLVNFAPFRQPYQESEPAPIFVVSAECTTAERRFNEVAGDRPNLFIKSRVRYIASRS